MCVVNLDGPRLWKGQGTLNSCFNDAMLQKQHYSVLV